MNKTIELINLWGAFEENHPKGNVEEFCRYYLAHHGEKVNNPKPKIGLRPVNLDAVLMRLLARIVKLHAIYSIPALEGTGLNQVEEFALLNAIKFLKEPRKTDVIYFCLHELSTGTDMLNRLKKNGFFTEYKNTEDKRSKRLKLTAKGEKALVKGHSRVNPLAQLMMHELSDEDKKLCIQLLKSVEEKFVGLWQGHKGKDFDEIYTDVVGRKGDTV
jgi:DNA-binding MarR family transcriptional regulator